MFAKGRRVGGRVGASREERLEKRNRTIKCGRKNKRWEDVYSVFFCCCFFLLLQAQMEAGAACHKNNHIPPSSLANISNARQQVGIPFVVFTVVESGI